MQDEPLTASASFQSARQFLVEGHGEVGWERVLAALRERHAIELPAEPRTGAWLPTIWYTSTLNVARDELGPPDFHERFGWAAAEYEMSWIHRVALRFSSPLWLLEQGAAYWHRAHTTGRWQTEGRKGWLRGTLRDFGVVDAGYCDSLRAWLQRACMMTGAGRMHIVERNCRARGGGDACVFEGTW
jgi:hypothetical protein